MPSFFSVKDLSFPPNVIAAVVRVPCVWSPRDIGRESWVWEERGALEEVGSPHKVGEEALAEWIPLSERIRSGPWVKWLLLLKLINF